MKNRIYDILSPVLYCILRHALRRLKPIFESEDETIRSLLMRKGFHPAVCAHPSIVFGHKSSSNYSSKLFLSLRVAILYKAIRCGMLKSNTGHTVMQELGVPHYYGNGLDFWFVESYSPIVPYSIPKTTRRPQRIAIYSALTGDYDNVNEVLYKENGVDYYLFTNNKKVQSNTWQVVYVESKLDNVLLSREIKMLPHKYLGAKYDASIYIDANAVIYGELSQLTNYLNDNVSCAVSKHGQRNTVRDEIDAVVRLKSVNMETAMAQYERYRAEGFKDSLGLAECTILVRRHNDPALIALMEQWRVEFQNGIRRDQISLMPCIDRMQFENYVLMDGYVFHNQYCKTVSHKQ